MARMTAEQKLKNAVNALSSLTGIGYSIEKCEDGTIKIGGYDNLNQYDCLKIASGSRRHWFTPREARGRMISALEAEFSCLLGGQLDNMWQDKLLSMWSKDEKVIQAYNAWDAL